MTYTWQDSPDVPVLERPVRQLRAPSETAPPADLVHLTSALNAIANSGANELDYDQWRTVVFGVHHATDGSDEGLALVHEFSSRSSKYDGVFLDERVWPYVKSERGGNVVTAASIYHLARQAGWIDPDAPAPDASGFECIEDTQLGADGTQSGAPDPYPIYKLADFVAQPPLKWIVKDVLPHAELGIVFGQSSSGKSFFVLDLCASIAQGTEWRGKRVKQCPVLYIAAEGAAGVRNRLIALAKHRGIEFDELEISVLPRTPDFRSRKVIGDVVTRAKAAGPFGLIVVDTLSQVSAGADENSTKDMGQVLANCRDLGAATGAMILIVHHSGKDMGKGSRGASTIKDRTDVEIEIVRAGKDRSATVSKLRDQEDKAEFGFRLHQVPVGVDEDGDTTTSCVLEYTAAIARDLKLKEPKGDYEVQIMDSVDALLGLGTDAPAPTKAGVLDHAVANMTTGRPKSNRTSLKRAFERLLARDALEPAGIGFRRWQAGD